MKISIINKIGLTALVGIAAAGCSKFEELNQNPFDANAQQVRVEFFINNAIVSAQQDPHIAERVFVLYWKGAGRQQRANNLAVGAYDDGYSTDYLRYASEWINHATTAIQIADEQIAADNIQPYTHNLKHVARIWRAYLMSELVDNFGPIPVAGFQGENPSFNSVQEVYYHLFDELKDAVSQLDLSVSVPSTLTRYDQAYGFDFSKWVRYANSMRMRLAMRLSEVDASKAQAEFEDAIRDGQYITEPDHYFSVQEVDGWNALAGVMSRGWNAQFISTTLNNLYLGLGGIPSANQLGSHLQASIKPEGYVGKRFEHHLATRVNDPARGLWMDGLPHSIDPRAYKTFQIPGDVNNPNYFRNGTTEDLSAYNTTYFNEVEGLVSQRIQINPQYTWNALATGNWGVISSRSNLIMQWFTQPVLVNNFRNHSRRRIFFADWESYFLIAEAGIRGWAVPMPAKEAYEAGVRASFAYWGVSEFAADYLASTDYNRAGTSANWDHTAEPPATHTVTYINGYTDANGTFEMEYPTNTIYKDGAVKNDLLTKIITQKFIAQTPWLPLEAWNDHRRLGLPFFENPAVENPLPNMSWLTPQNVMTNQINFFPQRLNYPSSLRTSDPAGYQQAVSLLGGEDSVFTPLWWAKQN